MSSFFEYSLNESPLQRRNPVIKLAAVAVIFLVVTPDLKPSTPWLDPAVPLVFLGILVIGTSIFGHIPLGVIIGRLLLPALLLMVLPALGAFLFDPAEAIHAPPMRLGPLDAYREGFAAGLGLALRLLTYFAGAITYMATTDPATFVASAVRQVRLSPQLGYSLLDRARFRLMSRQVRVTLRHAQRLRGADDGRAVAGQLPAAASRSTSRAALARTARGFGASEERTCYRQTPVTVFDWSFLMAVVGVTLVMIEVLIFAGMVDGFSLGL